MISTKERSTQALSELFIQNASEPKSATFIKPEEPEENKAAVFAVVSSIDQINAIVNLPEFKKHDVFLHTFNGKGTTCDISNLLESDSLPYAYARIQAFFKSLLINEMTFYPNVNYEVAMDYLRTVFNFLTLRVTTNSFAPSFLFTLLTNKKDDGLFIVKEDSILQENTQLHQQLLNYYQTSDYSVMFVQNVFASLEKEYLNYNTYALPEEAFNENNIHILVLGNRNDCFAERLIIERMAQLVTKGCFKNNDIHVFLEDYHRYRTIHTDIAFVHNYQPNIRIRKIQTARII